MLAPSVPRRITDKTVAGTRARPMVMIYGHSIGHSYEEMLMSLPELKVEPPVSTLTERPMGTAIIYQTIPHDFFL